MMPRSVGAAANECKEGPYLLDAGFDLSWPNMPAPRQPDLKAKASRPRSITPVPSRYLKRSS
jgi:hypothetical protein